MFRFQSSQRKPQPRAEEKTCRKARISTDSQSEIISPYIRRKSRQFSSRSSRKRASRSPWKYSSRSRISNGTWWPRWTRRSRRSTPRFKQYASRQQNDGPSHDGTKGSRIPTKSSNDGSYGPTYDGPTHDGPSHDGTWWSKRNDDGSTNDDDGWTWRTWWSNGSDGT